MCADHIDKGKKLDGTTNEDITEARIVREMRQAIKEVKLIKAGKRKPKPIEQVLNEL